MSTANTHRGMSISECDSSWTFRSCPSYAFLSEPTAFKKMCFGYLRALFVSNGFVSVTVSAKFTLLGHLC